MICANPDIVVERGDRLVYCAGALADAYAALGGEVYRAGKPHRPLYDLALGEMRAPGRAFARGDVPRNRVLAIGDSVRTDLKGAHDLGVDCLFVTAGIHAEELGHRGRSGPRGARHDVSAAGRRRGRDTQAGVVAEEEVREHLVDHGLVDPSPASCGPLSLLLALGAGAFLVVEGHRDPSRSTSASATRCSMCCSVSTTLAMRWPVMSWNEQASKMIIIFSSTSAL